MLTGSAYASFPITLSEPAAATVSVDWRTKDGTAIAGEDYAPNSGTVVFAPGETAKTINVLVYGRDIDADDRSFSIEIDPPFNAILGNVTAVCLITVSGDTPELQFIVPTGPKGDKGEDGVSPVLPTPEDIAESVAPLVNVNLATVTADGTTDTKPITSFMRRIAYQLPARIATAPSMGSGANAIPVASFTGDPVDFGAIQTTVKALRGTTLVSLPWSFDGTSVIITGASNGDIPVAVQYDTGNSTAHNLVTALKAYYAAPEGAERVAYGGSTVAEQINQILLGMGIADDERDALADDIAERAVIANNLSDLTDKAAAFNTIKQIASATETGVMRFATVAEARAGSAVAAVTPQGLSGAVLGMGQTLQDVTSSRASGTTYTNTSGRPIAVMISANPAQYTEYFVYINSNTVYRVRNEEPITAVNIFIIIPHGSTYSTNLPSIQKWSELR